MATAAEQSVQQSIVEATADVREVKEQLKGANGDEKVALQQRLAALEQRLATLEQQKLLLMQQQSGGLAAILKEQPLLVLLETLKEQQQQNYQQLSEQQQQLSKQQQLLSKQQQLLSEQQQQNYQGLVLDLFHSTSSVASSKELKRYRNVALEFYYGSSSYAEYTCMVTGMECSAGELVAGHIYRQQWPKSWLAKVGVTLHDPSNIIIMQSQLERAFDKWQWIVLPEGPDDYKVHVLYPPFLDDPSLRYISGNAGKSIRWQDIHGGKLKLPGLARPSRRLCGFHAALAIQNAEVQGWVPKGSVVLPDTAWDSPPCDKQLMQQFLNSLDLCGARRLQMSEAAEDDSVDEADM